MNDNPERDDQLIEDLHQLSGSRCTQCSHRLCGHEAIFAIALGFKNAPICLHCLAKTMQADVVRLRDDMRAFVSRRDCYLRAWNVASTEEGYGPSSHPQCLWPADESSTRVENDAPSASVRAIAAAPTPDVIWDAGDMACGDLVLALRIQLNKLTAGTVLKVIARDPAAPEDLPAWCRLTGHQLLHMQHPDYYIERKEDESCRANSASA